MKKFINEILLMVTYLAMAGVCIILSYNGGRFNDRESLVINVSMFVIVALIFGWAILGCFRKVNKIEKDLKHAIDSIKFDYERENHYLWGKYKEKNKSIFSQAVLTKVYRNFNDEIKRLESISEEGYRCDIEDYVNRELIDDVAKKNLLNLIPGAMTGMGILGTFIGLSLGLQNFNTGTSEEIEKSIAPLMDGIKIAFHTSIYGMVFSLVFNMVYKNVLENAYKRVDEFIDVYHTYVLPDAQNDNISKMIVAQQKQSEMLSEPIISEIRLMNSNILQILAVQQQQAQAINLLPQALEKSIGDKMLEQITPQFNEMNSNLKMFADKIGETQLDSMGQLIDRFTSQMNQNMADSFINLKAVISETCELEKQNSSYMQEILKQVGNMTLNIQQINKMSEKTINDMSGYIEKVEGLQNIITKNCEKFSIQLEKNLEFEENSQKYIEVLTVSEQQLTQSVVQAVDNVKKQVAVLEETNKQIINEAERRLENLAECANKNNELLVETARRNSEILVESMEKNNDLIKENANQNNSVLTESASKNYETLAESATRNYELLAETVKRQFENITSYSGASTEDMSRAALELGNVAKELNGKLKKNLNDTFDIFDSELAKITTHLSGTISNMEATTERVPRVVATAYEGMEKSFTEIEKQLTDLIKAVSLMQNNIQSVQKEYWSREKDEMQSYEVEKSNDIGVEQMEAELSNILGKSGV